MSSQNQHRNSGGSVLTIILRLLAFLLVALNGYFYCYPFFREVLGLYFPVMDGLLVQANFLFPYSKLLTLFLLGISIQGNPEKKKMRFKVSLKKKLIFSALGIMLFFSAGIFLKFSLIVGTIGYLLFSFLGFLLLVMVSAWLPGPKRVMGEGFPQNEERLENEYSVNFETEYIYKNKLRKGWINVINPFRASLVMGTPGSGKSFAVLVPAIKQMISKGFTAYIYDFKFPDLSRIAYNALRLNQHIYSEKYGKVPKFCVINFDDPRKSHRCNPIAAQYIDDLTDCLEASRAIMFNLNRSWAQQQGNFFIDSPVNFLAAILGFLWIYEKGKYCSLPHAIEFASLSYDQIFPILASYKELETLMSPFMSAFEKGATDQLEGQVASAKIGLGRLSSELIYWVMTGNDFDLNINNPQDPKILCVGNNPKRQDTYGAALALYSATLLRLINQKGRLPCAVVVDELPTIFKRKLDNLIATARSNLIAVWLGIQDLSQLIRDYGDKEAIAIFNTIGNLFSGQVKGQTAKILQTILGQIKREKVSTSTGSKNKSKNVSESLEYKITEGQISNLSQGDFVGNTADNFGEEVTEKSFHANIKVDMKAFKDFEARSVDIPELANFDSEEVMKLTLTANFQKIKEDVRNISENELARIANDPDLAHLIPDSESNSLQDQKISKPEAMRNNSNYEM